MFAGMEFDSVTGLYYNHARYYDAVLGRFVSQDPKGFAAGDTNLYRYVGNESTVGTDPSGEQEAMNYDDAMNALGNRTFGNLYSPSQPQPPLSDYPISATMLHYDSETRG